MVYRSEVITDKEIVLLLYIKKRLPIKFAKTNEKSKHKHFRKST